LKSLRLDRAILVVNSEGVPSVTDDGIMRIIRTGKNLGGAGGFARGMEEALLLGATWVWTCDDDALPSTENLVSDLLHVAKSTQLDLVAPIIVSPENHLRLSFPFRDRYRRIWDVASLKKDIILNQAHLFNGTLFSSKILQSVGLPDARLFIRGDEQEFLFRIIRAGFKCGTITKSVIIHPSGEDELYPAFFGILRISVPSSAFKFKYQTRNRGYLTRKYARFDWFSIDLLRYVSFFLMRRHPSFKGFRISLSLYTWGMLGYITREPDLDQTDWEEINSLRVS
jgi:rhamnopyranosyl-N-acetylglucosaminyl-diphospho-decaprenol beta-1,3/1,4-galactofuranosyltransferase